MWDKNAFSLHISALLSPLRIRDNFPDLSGYARYLSAHISAIKKNIAASVIINKPGRMVKIVEYIIQTLWIECLSFRNFADKKLPLSSIMHNNNNNSSKPLIFIWYCSVPYRKVLSEWSSHVFRCHFSSFDFNGSRPPRKYSNSGLIDRSMRVKMGISH